MKLDILPLIAIAAWASHVPASKASGTVPYGQPVPAIADGLSIQVKQNPRSTWNSAASAYWLPGSSFNVVDTAAGRGGQAAAAFGALGAAVHVLVATKASADKVEAGAATRLPDLESLTEQALREGFSTQPARNVLSPQAKDTHPNVSVTPVGTLIVANGGTEATLTVRLEAAVVDADQRVVWRGTYGYNNGTSQPISLTGWLAEGDASVSKTAERALVKLSRLIRQDLERQAYPDRKVVQVNRKMTSCGLMPLARKVTLLEADGNLRTVAIELDSRNGTYIEVMAAREFDPCIADGSQGSR